VRTGPTLGSLVASRLQRPRRRATLGPPADHRRRLLGVLAVLAVLFVVVAAKVVDLQVLRPDPYLEWGEAQRVSTRTLAAERGAILDRNGDELAISRPARTIFVDPELIAEPSVEAAQVAPLLGLDVTEVTAKMAGEGRFEYLARKVPVEVADQIEALGLAGVGILDESERYLPAGTSARSLVGTVDTDNQGTSGLEVLLGEQLTGEPGSVSLERSPTGRTIAVGEHSLEPAVAGDDVQLTIDRAIQYEAERLLGDQVAATEAKGGVAIVMVPDTGEILAMANMVRDPDTGEVVTGTNNAALTTQYEPGSVMKVATIAGALEAGLVDPSTTMTLPPTLQIYDDVFQEAEPRGQVTWSVADILAHSSNVGTIKIGQLLGPDRLHDVLTSFGFARPTAVGFPNEVPGALLDTDDWSGTSLATISIGQGVAVSPLQMLMAYNVIATGGEYVDPSLVRSTIDADGVEHPAATGSHHRVISEETAAELNNMLRSVVQVGTGKLAQVPGYVPAGKTGTAWKRQDNGTYFDAGGVRQYQSTFVGFVPAEQPALSVYVMIDEPRSGIYTGGATAAPVFSKLSSFALRRLGIPPAATDVANGGAEADASVETGAAPGGTSLGSTEVEDGRVRGVATGTPLPTTTTTTVPPPTTTTTATTAGGSTAASTGARPAGSAGR
jgi:cell division protein FtsI (penicillin-binding protein 3)